MRHSSLILFSFIALLALPVSAQKPVISPGGVLNAASFAAASGPAHALADGGIASIFGQNLAAATVSAASSPLPATLAGTSVTVNGAPAPLFYVSPTQINFQVPYSTDSGSGADFGHASIVVTTDAGSSDSIVVDMAAEGAGIFTMDGAGCGQGAVLNVKPDGTRSLNSPSNSASPGDYLEIYATGGGRASNAPADGAPASADPSARDYTCCLVALNFAELESIPYGTYFFAGKASGLVGVDQIDTLLPAGVHEGCAVPLQIGPVFGTLSQPVTVSIHSGGGQCVDPPVGSTGQLVLKRSVVLNDNTIPEADTFTASFSASPGKTVPFQGLVSRAILRQAPSCPVPGYSTLSAGAITVTPPQGSPIEAQPSIVNGEVSYQATLPAGSVQPGVFQISSNGGPDLGLFQTPIYVGAGIQITSQFPKGKGIGRGTVTWTGGQPGDTVTMNLVEHNFQFDVVWQARAPATSGTVSLPSIALLSINSSDLEIDIEVGPDPSPDTFSLRGLTLGAQSKWVYEYRFVGL